MFAFNGCNRRSVVPVIKDVLGLMVKETTSLRNVTPLSVFWVEVIFFPTDIKDKSETAVWLVFRSVVLGRR
jgi:hypothetical protein